MTLRILRDEADFWALKIYWDELLELSSICSPFLRWDWVWTWWEEFRSEFQLAIAVVLDETEKPVAIAPLMLGLETTGMRKHLRHLGFLAGLGEVKGERMDFLVPTGREAELTPILCRSFALLHAEWEAVRLNKLPEESPNRVFIVAALNQCSIGVNVVIRSECMCVQLGASWDAVELSLPSKRRRDLKRRWDLLCADHDAQELLAGPEDAVSRLDEFISLHGQHYPDGISTFVTSRSSGFHRRLGAQWISQGRALLPFVKVSSGMIAGLYGFVERTEFFFYQMGWDSSFRRYSLGHQMIRWTLKSCVDRRLDLFDMLPGSYRYKKDWAGYSRFVLDLEAYQPESLRAALFRAFRHVKRQFRSSSEVFSKPE